MTHIMIQMKTIVTEPSAEPIGTAIESVGARVVGTVGGVPVGD